MNFNINIIIVHNMYQLSFKDGLLKCWSQEPQVTLVAQVAQVPQITQVPHK